MFMGVNSKCAHQVRPPLTGMRGLCRRLDVRHRFFDNSGSARWGASCPRQGNPPTHSAMADVFWPFSLPVFSGLQAQWRKVS